MSLHHDLLEQARHLAKRERRRPRQASLRRSISAAYYAVFHLLVHEGSSLLASGTGVPRLKRMFTRGFHHEEMKTVSQAVARRQWPGKIAANIGTEPISDNLAMIAERFVEFQEYRHDADYDIMQRYSRGEVDAMLDQVQQIFDIWSNIRKDPATRIFLAALFAGRKIKA